MVANYGSAKHTDKVGMLRKASICSQMRLVPYVLLSRLPADDKGVASALL